MSANFRVLDLGPGSEPVQSNSLDQVAPPPPGVVRWIDIQEQSEAEMKVLSERFRFHPLTLEDCLPLTSDRRWKSTTAMVFAFKRSGWF